MSSLMPAAPRVALALDFDNEADVLSLVEKLAPEHCRLKVGKELFTACGPQLVRRLVSDGFDVFLDLKFHDIPNTVASALKAAQDLGVWMVNVHASGGSRMLEAARTALSAPRAPILIAVTVLTSMEQVDLQALGISGGVDNHVMRLARLTRSAGLDGVVCSARETAMLKDEFGAGFCLVTPGIRPAGAALGDQRRVLTPAEALQQGSHYLVIGRPVTQSADPLAALLAINDSIAGL